MLTPGVILLGWGRVARAFVEEGRGRRWELLGVVGRDRWTGFDGKVGTDLESQGGFQSGEVPVQLLLQKAWDLIHTRGLMPVLVDASFGTGTAVWLEGVRGGGFGVVSANKLPLVALDPGFFEILRRQGLGVRAACGVGLELAAAIDSVQRGGGEVLGFTAQLSGSLLYLLEGLGGGASGEDLLIRLRGDGVMEPESLDDLCLTDVLRKALILARWAGACLCWEDVRRGGLLPLPVKGRPDAMADCWPIWEQKVRGAVRSGERLLPLVTWSRGEGLYAGHGSGGRYCGRMWLSLAPGTGRIPDRGLCV